MILTIMAINPIQQRDEIIKRMEKEQYQILVIGGGITGAGIARDAALRGLKVALVEKADFARGTSSRSSKLIHGGLRYLEHLQFRLVSEALRERKVQWKVAPHLVHPLQFVIPIFKGYKPNKLEIRAGLWLYDILALTTNYKRHSFISAEDALKKVPTLKKDILEGAGIYYDFQMNDARLCLENVLSAAEYGADVLNYAEVIGFKNNNNKPTAAVVHDVITGKSFEITAEVFINATGPWIDQLCQLQNPNSRSKVVWAKGVHIIAPKLPGEDVATVMPTKDKRIIFTIPWFGYTLIGTTDTPYEGDLDNPKVTEDDVNYLLEHVNYFHENANLTKDDILATFAGVRPLILKDSRRKTADVRTADLSREDKIYVEADGHFISIGGGKYTTYRKMAQRITDKVIKIHKFKADRCRTHKIPLPGGKVDNWESFMKEEIQKLSIHWNIPEKVAKNLIHTYGTRIETIIEYLKEQPELNEPLSPDSIVIKAEVLHSFKFEMAVTLEDFLRRRTLLWSVPGRGLNELPSIKELLVKYVGWTEEQFEAEASAYEQVIKPLWTKKE